MPLPAFQRADASPYDRFLEGVRNRTPKGSTIAVIVPVRRYEPDYAYHLYRANYMLSGRTVVPAMSRENTVLAQNVQRSDYIALWGVRLHAADRRPVWTEGPGQLLRR